MADRDELTARVEALEQENAGLRERNDELETKLHRKLEESLAIQAEALDRPPRSPAVPAVMMVTGSLIGVAGAFASNVLAMLAGLVMLSSGVIWGRQQTSDEDPTRPEP